MSLIFALMALGLAVNQVATGLALTILGVGLSGLIGAGFVGTEVASTALALGCSVQLLDVAPTVLELLDVPVPPNMRGRSLLQ